MMLAPIKKQNCALCFHTSPLGQSCYPSIHDIRRAESSSLGRSCQLRTRCQATRKLGYAGRHRSTTRPVKYEVVRRDDADEFDIGSELVPLDSPVIIQQQQRGFFPLLQSLVPRESELEVLITRDLDLAETWIQEMKSESLDGVRWLGYTIHNRSLTLRRGTRLAFVGKDQDFIHHSSSPQPRPLEKKKNECYLSEAEEEHLAYRLDSFQDMSGAHSTSVLSHSSDLESVEDMFTEEIEGEYDNLVDNGPVVYHVGNVVITDYHPPKRKKPLVPPPQPPFVFTHDPTLASFWFRDPDKAEDNGNLPLYAVPVSKNIVSLLTLCSGKRVLILQLRRMAGIGPELANFLYSEDTNKMSFDHSENNLYLEPIGVKIRNGHNLQDLLLKSMERETMEDVPKAFRTQKEHQLVRVLAGVDISDRDLYSESWNNPLLSQKELVCLAKEAFGLYCMGKVLSEANYTHFFNIDIFVLNPIPPSFLEQTDQYPTTTTHEMIIQRSRFYEDLGKILKGMYFPLKITATRDIAVAEQWAHKQLKEHQVTQLGFHQEWVQGRRMQITALFTLATRNEVLICQQLYFPEIPPHLKNLMEWRHIRKTGRAPYFRVVKKDQGPISLRGFEHLFSILLHLSRKKRKRNLPKVFKDLDFRQLGKILIGVDSAMEGFDKDVRWDKPLLSTEEIEYQAVQAWLGWALIHIFCKSTPEHAERLKAFLLGPRFVPKPKRLPALVKKNLEKMEQLEREQREFIELERFKLRAQQEEIEGEENFASVQGQSITHKELNLLFDSIYQKSENVSETCED